MHGIGMHRYGFGAFAYEKLSDIRGLTKEEKRCIQLHGEQIWHALKKGKPLPSLKLCQLLRSDFTYHGVDMRSFIPQTLKQEQPMFLCASTLYVWKGKWRIYLCICYP